MEENEEDAERTDVLHQEEVKVEKGAAQRAPVGELVADDFVGDEPTDEDAGEEAHHGEENLTRHEVEDVEQRHAEELQPVVAP